MRGDADRLLERLGEPDFVYHEFAGRFSDLELWPLFSHILADPRLDEARCGISLPDTHDRRRDSAAPTQDVRFILEQLAEMAAAGTL